MRILNEAIFWLHLAFILMAVSTGLFLPLGIVAFLVLIHRAHMIILGDCFLSQIQRLSGGLPKSHGFLQVAVNRFTGREISKKQSKYLDYCIALSPLVIAISKNSSLEKIITVSPYLLITFAVSAYLMHILLKRKSYQV